GVLQQPAGAVPDVDGAVLQDGTHASGPVSAERLGVLTDPFGAVDDSQDLRFDLGEQVRASGEGRADRPQRLGISAEVCVHAAPASPLVPSWPGLPYGDGPAPGMGRTNHGVNWDERSVDMTGPAVVAARLRDARRGGPPRPCEGRCWPGPHRFSARARGTRSSR